MAAKRKQQTEQECLIHGCKKSAIWRGLCKSCYGAAAYKIRQAKKTGKLFDGGVLEAKGLALPRNDSRATAMSKELAKQ